MLQVVGVVESRASPASPASPAQLCVSCVASAHRCAPSFALQQVQPHPSSPHSSPHSPHHKIPCTSTTCPSSFVVLLSSRYCFHSSFFVRPPHTTFHSSALLSIYVRSDTHLLSLLHRVLIFSSATFHHASCIHHFEGNGSLSSLTPSVSTFLLFSSFFSPFYYISLTSY